jgi:hypothetical protein
VSSSAEACGPRKGRASAEATATTTAARRVRVRAAYAADRYAVMPLDADG